MLEFSLTQTERLLRARHQPGDVGRMQPLPLAYLSRSVSEEAAQDGGTETVGGQCSCVDSSGYRHGCGSRSGSSDLLNGH